VSFICFGANEIESNGWRLQEGCWHIPNKAIWCRYLGRLLYLSSKHGWGILYSYLNWLSGNCKIVQRSQL